MITPAAIRHLIGEPDYSRGVEYFRRGKVIDFGFVDEGFIGGTVEGSGRRVYEQDIGLVRGRDGTLREIEGTCTCPVGWNCKHVAAVLLAARTEVVTLSAAAPPARTQAPTLPGAVDVWLQRLAEAAAVPARPRTRQRNCSMSFTPIRSRARGSRPGRGASSRAGDWAAIRANIPTDRTLRRRRDT